MRGRAASAAHAPGAKSKITALILSTLPPRPHPKRRCEMIRRRGGSVGTSGMEKGEVGAEEGRGGSWILDRVLVRPV